MRDSKGTDIWDAIPYRSRILEIRVQEVQVSMSAFCLTNLRYRNRHVTQPVIAESSYVNKMTAILIERSGRACHSTKRN